MHTKLMVGLVCVLCACTPGDGGDDGGPGDAAPADAVIVLPDAGCMTLGSSHAQVRGALERLARAICAGRMRCPFGAAYPDVDSCVARSNSVIPGGNPAFMDWRLVLLPERSLVVDGRALDACESLIESICWYDAPVLLAGPCAQVFGASCPLDAGAACRFDAECAPAGFCDRNIGESCAIGTCHPRRALGERCTSSVDCIPADDLAVLTTCTGSSRTCGEARLLEPVLGEGESCVWTREGNAEIVPRCLPGLSCDGSVCTRPGDVGAPCTFDADCVTGVECASDGRCESAVPLAEGDPCTEPGECGIWVGLVCDVSSGRCVTWDQTRGSACHPDDAPCGLGLACISGRCGDPNPVGERCFRDDQCASGCCGDDLLCAPAPAP